MKILRLDSVGGISGDMLLGVLTGLGAAPEKITAALRTIVPQEEFKLVCEPVRLNGLSGVRAKVEIPREGHCHRTMADIAGLLEKAALPEAVRKDALGVFRLLAEAEGAVHGMPPEEVTFHEVGALDSIIDIAGCCMAWHELGIGKLLLNPLPTGSGVVRTAHGLMPVPAPATAEILSRYHLETASDDEPFELVTPTGAALAAYWPKVPKAAGKVCGTVNSFGQRELLSRPNLLRGMLLETVSEIRRDTVKHLSCNLDDMTGEMLGHAAEALLAAGALDVWTEPVFMKKQRPGVVMNVLCRNEEYAKLLPLIFRETTTFGVREQEVARTVLDRDFVTAETTYGPVKVKQGRLAGETVSRSPEWEDCKRAAAKAGVPARIVYAEAQKK